MQFTRSALLVVVALTIVAAAPGENPEDAAMVGESASTDAGI